jgi:hypothetical protein
MKSMKKEEKHTGRSTSQDSLPHDIAVAIVSSAVTTATSVGVKAAIKEIKGRVVKKPKHSQKKSKR